MFEDSHPHEIVELYNPFKSSWRKDLRDAMYLSISSSAWGMADCCCLFPLSMLGTVEQQESLGRLARVALAPNARQRMLRDAVLCSLNLGYSLFWVAGQGQPKVKRPRFVARRFTANHHTQDTTSILFRLKSWVTLNAAFCI